MDSMRHHAGLERRNEQVGHLEGLPHGVPADTQPVASSPKRSAPDDDDSRQPGKLPRIPNYDIIKQV
jgi:hypothetical protein